MTIEPIPLRGEATVSAPFPIDATGATLAGAIRAIMHRVQVPDAIAAHSVLAAVSVAIQAHVLMELPTREVKPPSLFFATVADSGDRKTTSDNIAIQPIKDYELELNEEYQTQKQVYNALHAIWKGDAAQLAKDNKGRDAATVAAAVADMGNPPTEPPRPAILVPPGSTQGVIDMLEKGRPSIGLFINEGGSWLGSWGMSDENRTATISAYSEMWDGQPIKTLTKGEGFRFMPNRAFSFHVMFQPVYVQQMFGDAEMRGQGFLSRVLAAQPTSLAGTRLRDVNAVEPPEVEQAILTYHERLARVVRAALPIDPTYPQNGLTGRRSVGFNPDAAALFWAFYNHIETQQSPGGTLAGIRGFAGKSTEMAARLAVIIHVFQDGMNAGPVSAPAMARGIELMNFYIGEALRLADTAPADEKADNAQVLSDWLRDKWDAPEIGFRNIRQSGPGKLRKLPPDDLREICALLVRNDHLTVIGTGATVQGKHCKEAWKINVRA
ncbi:YfjI family protein [Sphingomonas prati]|uniref:YfjI family protein n=1 Tax=Sphingomonas prati TaxID=1843237 RepID=UPI0012F6DFBE|nr:YfjI family protein [Sphingomonas prati]